VCTNEIIVMIKDSIITIAAATTAIVAYKGLAKWQKELKGKANFDTARLLIRATYKLRDEMKVCRSPFILLSEFPKDYNPLNKGTAEDKGNTYAHVYGKRWEHVAEAIQEFDVHTLEAEALWGTQIREKTNELRQCTRNLHASIQAFIENEYSDGEHFKDKAFRNKIRNDIYLMKEDKNPLSLKINTSIKTIENEIRPHLDNS